MQRCNVFKGFKMDNQHLRMDNFSDSIADIQLDICLGKIRMGT